MPAPLILGIPYLFEGAIALGGIWGLSSVSNSVAKLAESGKTAQESASNFFKEVIIPGALIYAAYIYYQNRNKS